jgi:D-alanine-D-alanine ligase
VSKPLRVAILTHEDLIPPTPLKDVDDKERLAFQTERDVYVALRKLGHDVRFLGVSWDLLPIRELVEEWKPDVVFNLLMEFQDVGAFQVHLVSYLELLGVPYTGCNPRGVLLSRDKAVCKKILRHHRIPTPDFAVFDPGRRVRPPPELTFPLIVKSVDEEASFGIAQASVVRDEDALAERVRFIHEHVGTPAIAEEYVDGRELTISLLGNERLRAFPVWEMQFRNLPEGSVPIATERAKYDKAYQKRVGIRCGKARDLSDRVVRRIQRLARRTYRSLGLSGYARLDLRLTPEGKVFVIEVNATPDVKREEDFALSAKAAGIEYPRLLQRIVDQGLRYRPYGKRDGA